MPTYVIRVNGARRSIIEVLSRTPRLWVLRDHLRLTGTKYGCGVGLCGSCTVLLDGDAVRSCAIGVDDVGYRERRKMVLLR